MPSERIQHWLSRFAFSLLIIAAVLLWEAHKLMQFGTPPTARIVVYVVLAGASVALGVAGIRWRHRRDDLK